MTITNSHSDIERLTESFTGDVLAPGDPRYDDVRRVHNGLVDKRPAVIARCLNSADVSDAVNFARDQELEISVRGGGHNVAGRAVCDGGLMIDLAPMKGVHVDPARRAIRAQGGVTWKELNRAAGAFDLATTGGTNSTTGIAGLTLGGGIGWLMGKHGTAADNLLSAEVVLASGEIVTASEGTDPDLFWAIRGGGGNFGVVTSFEYRAHPLSTVLGGPVLHEAAAAPELFRFYRDFCPELPDELGTQAGFLHAPDGSGTKLCVMALCHAGEDSGRAEADVRAMREFGSPVADLVQRMPYPVINTLLDAMFPRGALSYWKSAFFPELSDDAVAAAAQAFDRAPTDMCFLVFERFSGAVTRVDPTATAYPHRQPGYNLLLISQWTDPEQTDIGIAWARETFDALRPYMADRAYVNYMDSDDDDRIRQAYGPNYERLAQLKERYDPTNLFHLNQNVTPSRNVAPAIG